MIDACIIKLLTGCEPIFQVTLRYQFVTSVTDSMWRDGECTSRFILSTVLEVLYQYTILLFNLKKNLTCFIMELKKTHYKFKPKLGPHLVCRNKKRI